MEGPNSSSWGWLLEQARTASPFVAVFCLVMLASVTWTASLIIRKLWKQHLHDQEEIKTLAREVTAANNAAAHAIERSTASTISEVRQTLSSVKELAAYLHGLRQRAEGQ